MAPPKSRTDLWISASLLAAILAVYGQVRSFEFLDLDDPDSVSNPHVLHGLTLDGLRWAFQSTANANWFPLTWISHMLDRQFFGGQSGYHHLTNLLIHSLSSVLLFFVMKRLTQARWPSAFVAFVFALHPLHVESVAWIAERKDVLSALFWILTMGAYARYVERPGAARYSVVIAVFALGLMSKAMLVTLPFALLLLDWWPLKRLNRRAILEKLPMIALSAAVSFVTFYAQRRGGAVSTLEQIPLSGRIENALVSYVAYLIQFIWPANLAVFYPYQIPSLPAALLAAAALAAITIWVIRARRRRYLAIGWLWYLGTLVPVIGLVQVGQQSRADRYTYLPLIGISIILAWSAAEWKIARPLLGFACAIWFFITWNQVTYWRNSIALFEHAIQVTSDNDLAYYSLGTALRMEDRLDEAVVDFQRALAIHPQSGPVENALGEALLREGHLDDAMPHLTEAVGQQPDSADARANLATALNMAGRVTEAEAQYRLAIHYNPASAEAHGGLGVVLHERGRQEDALAELQESLRLKPEDGAGHYNLGRVYSALGRNEDALAQYREAVRLQPRSVDAHISLGAALNTDQRSGDALQEFLDAERLNPNSVGAHFNAATTLAGMGRYDEAIQEFTEALRLNPELAAAKQNIEFYSILRSKSAQPR